MIGQKLLIDEIDSILENRAFPRFSIVVGDRGMEHEDVAHYVANYMSADYIQLQDVKVDTIREMIKQAYSLHHLTVYCIPHADEMSVNAKNALLKVVEDVPNKAYFIMCLEDLNNTLATIQSRGVVFKMCQPKPDDIKEFARELYVDKKQIDEEEIKYIGEICRSAGDVIYMTHHGAKNFYRYAQYVADNVTNVSGAEVFKFSDKLALKDEEDKYEVRLFLRALQYVLMNEATKYLDKDAEFRIRVRVPALIGKYMQDLRVKGINKGMLMDNLWLEVRKLWKSQT